jgi:2-keto-4-pentenoate hydratase/2-oxohepta-3-ene-1,7-dioic acid hydratase in catechol pathway
VRFVTFVDADDRDRVGLVVDDRVHALAPGVALLDLLGDDGHRLHEAGGEALRDPRAVYPYDTLRLRAPIPAPPTVRDFMTFEQHVAGVVLLAGRSATVPDQWYRAPAFYFTNPYAVLGPHDDVPVAPGSELFDFELEVAAVVGLAGHDLDPGEAEKHIAGYTLLNDWSARDIQFAEMLVRLGPVKGKDTATTLGPVFVTPDELAPYRAGTSYDLGMTAAVNGEVIGRDRWDNMAYSYGEMIAYASRGTQVRPGDVLGSGTCGGGCLAEYWGRRGRRTPPPLKAGDTVTISVEQLGTLTSRLTAGAEPVPIARRR